LAPARIERWDVRLDGPLSEDALLRKIEQLGFVLAARTYPSGLAAATTDSRDGVTAVVRGLVKLTINGEPELLTAGDVAFVPAGAERRLEMVGPAPALCLEAFAREQGAGA
jgi:mannose-6-phosphate isomerase-like protein (cupin superfamily)